MEEILKADIFFFIATVSVVVVAIMVCILLYHLIKTVKLVERVASRLEEGGEVIAKDLSRIRTKLFGGSVIGLVAGTIGALTTGLNKFRSEWPGEDTDEETVADKKKTRSNSKLSALVKSKRRRKSVKVTVGNDDE